MTIRTKISALEYNVPIVDPGTGMPSMQFGRKWQSLFQNEEETAAVAFNAVPKTRRVKAGDGLTGGGSLDADLAINVGAGTGIVVNDDDVAIDIDAEAERVRDVVASALVEGANITITVNDADDTIEIAAAGTSVEVQDEGVTATTALVSLNFTGAGVTATDDGSGNVEVAIAGKGGGYRPMVTGDNPPVFLTGPGNDLIMTEI
jgi:hypothetical protein